MGSRITLTAPYSKICYAITILNYDTKQSDSFSNKFINCDYSAIYMTEKYYLDTSIWLDFLENRNGSNLPKGDWAHKLLDKITENNDKAIYS